MCYFFPVRFADVIANKILLLNAEREIFILLCCTCRWKVEDFLVERSCLHCSSVFVKAISSDPAVLVHICAQMTIYTVQLDKHIVIIGRCITSYF